MLVGCIIGGAIGAYVGRTKGRQTEGMLFGALLGPLGWIIVLLMPAVQSSASKGVSDAYLKRVDARHLRQTGQNRAADEEWNKAVNGE